MAARINARRRAIREVARQRRTTPKRIVKAVKRQGADGPVRNDVMRKYIELR